MFLNPVLFWAVLACAFVAPARNLPVYSFQENSSASNSFIWRSFEGQQQFELQTFTFCVRFKFFGLHEVAGLVWLFKNLSATSNHENNFQIELSLSRLRVSIGGARKYFFLKEDLRALTWHHLCCAFSHHNRTASIVLDGEVQQSVVVEEAMVLTGRMLKVGAIDNARNFYGKITQANFWSSLLSVDQMAAIGSCDNDDEGDVVAWSEPWQTNGSVSEEEINIHELCHSINSEQFFIFEPQTASEAASLCRRVSASLPMPGNMTQVHNLVDKTLNYIEDSNLTCDSLWVDLTDADTEGQWRSYYGNEMVSNITWKKGQPDGDIVQNCAAVVLDDVTGFRDRDCFMTNCVVCELQHFPVWTFRGTCDVAENNKKFVALQPVPGELLFRGYADHIIKLENGTWTWGDQNGNKTIATLVRDSYGRSWPMGRRKWVLKQPLCGKNIGDDIILLLTPCSQDQYTCDDASCVPLTDRCDLKPECADGSDETECQIIVFPPSYRSDIPPQGLSSAESLPVTLYIMIESASVDTTDMLLHVNFNLSMLWTDKRISYLNLNKEMRQNMVPDEAKQKLWAPVVDFTNTKGNHFTLVDSEANMMVSMRGKHHEADDIRPEEVELYWGAENDLFVSRKYSKTFQCKFYLARYPFDVQGCAMQLTMMSASSELLTFDQRSKVEYLGNPQLIEYSIDNVSVSFNNGLEFARLYVEVVLERRSGFILMNVYIPSLCLLFISYLSLYFKPSIFQVRVLGSLTTLLVMATLFTQASSSLPKTSYFKLVDVWLLSSILIIFTIIIFHTIIDRSLELDPVEPAAPRNEQQQNSTLKHHSHSIRPAQEVKTSEPSNSWVASDPVEASAENGPDLSILKKFQADTRATESASQPQEKKRPLSRILILAARIIILLVLVLFNIIYWSFVLFGQ